MEGSSSSNLRLWTGWVPTAVQDLPASKPGADLPHLPFSTDLADRLYTWEALNPSAALPRQEEGAEPYSLQWFLRIESQRHSRHGRWIPKLLEFSKHSGETLLGLGNGLGTDWLQYARNGASVVVCSPSVEQLALIRCNFHLRGLTGRFLHSTPWALPLENASIDVACVSSFLHEIDDHRAVVDEVYLVLKPGGKVLAVAGARFDVDFWFRACFPWLDWFGKKRTTREDVAVRRYHSRSLCRLFDRFADHRVHKRHLRRSEVPHVWRWVPHSLLERLMGRVLVLKAFKPLSSAIALPVAA